MNLNLITVHLIINRLIKKMETVILSKKGSIEIPGKIRQRMRLKESTEFIILEGKDSLTLKRIYKPVAKDFEDIVDWGTKFAKEKGITPEDVLEVLEKS